jgi:hypothetical protein
MMYKEPKDNETHMRIGTVMGAGDWPHCIASIEPVEVASGAWEFRFAVPIPEKLWEMRAEWPIGTEYEKHLVKQGKQIDVRVKEGYVESVVLKGSLPYKRTLELRISQPGDPMEPTNYHSGPEREDRILDSITPDDYDEHEGGTCWYCHEQVLEGTEDCPDCGVRLSREAPTIGELVEKYGPDATVFVYFHDRSVSLNVRYTLDDAGLAKEKADKQAKYDAELTEYELLKIEWDQLVEKVNAYGAAKNESDERAKLAALKEKYEA